MISKVSPSETPPAVNGSEGVGTLNETEHATASTTGEDPVAQIALHLMEGRLSPQEAVDQLIVETMNLSVAASAPESVRRDMEALLRSFVETDPQMKALAAALR